MSPVPESSGAIPDSPEGTPTAGGQADGGGATPLHELPAKDFWEAIYERRSIRKFLPEPVPRELVDQVMHAGIWAPSSCNYQMWDLVAVDDPEVNAQLAALSLQMSNAPVNIIVSYGRDFSEENYANIQSASALIQNMSLAAQVLGLGTFWITQTGDSEKVRETVGLPLDRMVIAVLALGYPKVRPKRGPKRRPLGQVTHYNHYAGRAIPSSVDPEDWEPDLLATYQRARVLNGLRHNKPRAWEVRALLACLHELVPEGREKPASGEDSARWLDVLPCTGIVTEKLSLERRGFAFDVAERTAEVARWCADRVRPKGAALAWPEAAGDFDAPEDGAYDVVSCFYRLEDLARAERERLVRDMARWVKPGGKVLVGYVSARSYHDLTERMRRRRGGPGGVEYVLSPDPNIGPFQALEPWAVDALFTGTGLRRSGELSLQPTPQPEEVAFRARNFKPRSKKVAGGLGKLLAATGKLPGVEKRYGRFRYVAFTRTKEA
ncbi:MAG: methyltransferase domain-containing protein [bacterium]|nr:methyltransferase domain-containing protein [bacterium]